MSNDPLPDMAVKIEPEVLFPREPRSWHLDALTRAGAGHSHPGCCCKCARLGIWGHSHVYSSVPPRLAGEGGKASLRFYDKSNGHFALQQERAFRRGVFGDPIRMHETTMVAQHASTERS